MASIIYSFISMLIFSAAFLYPNHHLMELGLVWMAGSIMLKDYK